MALLQRHIANASTARRHPNSGFEAKSRASLGLACHAQFEMHQQSAAASTAISPQCVPLLWQWL
jgi:hypothetical protein